MSEKHAEAGPPKLWLSVGTQSIPLERGTTVRTDDLSGLGPSGMVFAQVNPNPHRPDILGLQNLSDRKWTVRLLTGETKSVEPQETVKLAEGLQFDLGGVTGLIRSRQMIAPAQPIERVVMERLAGTLQQACEKNRLSKEHYTRMHALFFAHDDKGTIWTIGLNTKMWHKVDSDQWVPGNPPRRLFIAAQILEQLMKLDASAT